MVPAMAARSQALVVDGTHLCVYPGLYGLCLAGPWPPDLPWQETLRATARLKDAFISVASRVARNAHVYLVPGSVLVAEGAGLLEWSGLFGPDGALLGEQAASQPDAALPEKVLARRLAPIETPFGPVGLLLGADADVPEVARILALQGCRLLIAPRAPAAPYSAARAMAGLWQMVQQNQVFGLESGLSGRALGVDRAGKAGAVAPAELSSAPSGFLGRPGYFVGDGALGAELDFDQLEALRERRPLARHLNPGLYRHHADAFRAAPGHEIGAHLGEHDA